MPTRIQFRRGTAAQWTSANPVLAEGELGLETDTQKYKIGNGTDTWSSISYQSLPGNAFDITDINAKGDLMVGSADNSAAILPVGSNGQLLVADSSAANGVKWANPVDVGDIALVIALGGL